MFIRCFDIISWCQISPNFSYCSSFCLLNTESQVCGIQQTDAVPADRLSSGKADENKWDLQFLCRLIPRHLYKTCIHWFLFKNISFSSSKSIYDACSLKWQCCIHDLQLKSMPFLFRQPFDIRFTLQSVDYSISLHLLLQFLHLTG